jgi:RND family efflux transporter MFP subunit
MPVETNHADAEGNRQQVVTQQHGHNRVSTEASSGTGAILAVAVVVILILLGVGFTIAYLVHQHAEEAAVRLAASMADAQPIVDVYTAHPAAQSYPLTLPGQTAGWYESTIFARVDGYVKSWSADIGDHVKQGQVLALIDTPELDQQLNGARAKEATSASQVTVAEASVSIAKITYERWRDSPTGVVAEQERQEKEANYNESVAQLSAAKAQEQADKAGVDRFMAMEEFKKVTAPYDGIITSRKIDVGNLVSAGSSSNTTSLYTIAQYNVIRVFVDVPQKAGAQILVGLPADITSNQHPDQVFHGKVARSSMSMDTQTRTQKTEVDIANSDLALVPGMYVQVTFQLNQGGLLEVPAAAILFRPGGLQVAVINDDNRVEFRPITVAKDNGDTVVLQSGVREGETVALNLSSAIEPGEEVTIGYDQTPPKAASPPAKESELHSNHISPPYSEAHPPSLAKAPSADR